MHPRLLALSLFSAAAIAAPALVPAQALAAAPISMTTAAFRDAEVKSASGAVEHHLTPAARVVPGETVVYVLTLKNSGSAPADKLVVNNPLARGLEYVGPREGPAPLVSVDGGKAFGPLPQLTVRAADGSTRPAQASDVTNLRWTLPTAVPAGGEGRVAFAAKLK